MLVIHKCHTIFYKEPELGILGSPGVNPPTEMKRWLLYGLRPIYVQEFYSTLANTFLPMCHFPQPFLNMPQIQGSIFVYTGPHVLPAFSSLATTFFYIVSSVSGQSVDFPAPSVPFTHRSDLLSTFLEQCCPHSHPHPHPSQPLFCFPNKPSAPKSLSQ